MSSSITSASEPFPLCPFAPVDDSTFAPCMPEISGTSSSTSRHVCFLFFGSEEEGIECCFNPSSPPKLFLAFLGSSFGTGTIITGAEAPTTHHSLGVIVVRRDDLLPRASDSDSSVVFAVGADFVEALGIGLEGVLTAVEAADALVCLLEAEADCALRGACLVLGVFVLGVLVFDAAFSSANVWAHCGRGGSFVVLGSLVRFGVSAWESLIMD